MGLFLTGMLDMAPYKDAKQTWFLTWMLDMAPHRDAGHTMALQLLRKHTPLQNTDMKLISKPETLICPLKGSFELS